MAGLGEQALTGLLPGRIHKRSGTEAQLIG
jgi:hypothetical protein